MQPLGPLVGLGIVREANHVVVLVLDARELDFLDAAAVDEVIPLGRLHRGELSELDRTAGEDVAAHLERLASWSTRTAPSTAVR